MPSFTTQVLGRIERYFEDFKLQNSNRPAGIGKLSKGAERKVERPKDNDGSASSLSGIT